MRKIRLKEIQKILNENQIGSHEAILNKLRENGISITQATLSRDFAFLKVVKMFVPGTGYIYAMPRDVKRYESRASAGHNNLIGLLSLKFSRNILVAKTLPGYATQICVQLDELEIPQIVGTIAGDDTIFIVVDENVGQEQFRKLFAGYIPEVKDRL